MEAGTVLEWHVAPGDRVRRGDLVALVDTDKAAIEIECFEDGVVEEILVAAGAKVPVGTPLARIAAAAAASGASAAPHPTRDRVGVRNASVRIHASPLARRAAAELDVDLAQVMAGSLRTLGVAPDAPLKPVEVARDVAAVPESL